MKFRLLIVMFLYLLNTYVQAQISKDSIKTYTQFPLWSSIQNNLKEGEALVEIVRADTTGAFDYYYLVLHPNSKGKPTVIHVQYEGRPEKQIFDHYREYLEGRKPDHQSYTMLWENVDKILRKNNVTQVYVKSDGYYHLVNLITLYNTTEQKYVLDYYTVINIINVEMMINK